MNKDIFEVTRNDYKSFVSRLIQGSTMSCEEDTDENTKQMCVYSIKTGKLLCAREYGATEEVIEKYYIFEYPEADEWGPVIPRTKIVLETPEEVQAVLEALAKMREQNND